MLESRELGPDDTGSLSLFHESLFVYSPLFDMDSERPIMIRMIS